MQERGTKRDQIFPALSFGDPLGQLTLKLASLVLPDRLGFSELRLGLERSRSRCREKQFSLKTLLKDGLLCFVLREP